ncbi:MAG: hypothetical protein AABY22_01180, partial [Nanoarchaeota archaeon]
MKNIEGAICQSYSSQVISEVCSANQIFPGKCGDTSQCQIGTCIDEDEGVCSPGATKGVCEANGGKWNPDANANILECRKGCCILGDNVQYTTEARCDKLSLVYGSLEEDNFKQVSNELECLALAPDLALESGACVLSSGNCKFTTLQNCAKLNGDFTSGLLCSHVDLNTICKKQDHVDCVEGKDEIYWFDSCGNRENIYSSDKEQSFNDGNILSKDQSCNPNSANADSSTCGNCNYLLGSKCSASTIKKINDGNFICKDLSCDASADTGGEKRENGESWCAYDSYIGDGKDTVGSRHWKRVCIDGGIQVEPCADYRGEICVQSDVDVGNGEKISNAACVINRAIECVDYNKNKKTMEKNCKENSDCVLTKVNVDDGFKFEICTAKYPRGFQLEEPDARESSSAQQLCSLANQKCTVIYEKKFSGWKCIENCDCETKKFSEEMNNLCIALGDCGSYVNFIGEGTNNIKVKGAPKVSWTSYTKYSKVVPGQKAEPEDIEDIVKRIGFGGRTEEYDSSKIIQYGANSLGSTGVLLKLVAVGMVASGSGIFTIPKAAGLVFSGEIHSFSGLGAAPSWAAWGNALAGAGIGASVGGLVAKGFGLQGDATLAVVLAGAIGGGIGAAAALGTFGAGAQGVATAGGLFGGAGLSGSILAGGLWGLVAALIVVAIVKLLGIGDIKK